MLAFILSTFLLVTASLCSGARLHRRQTNFGGGSGEPSNPPSTDTRFFGLLGGLFGGDDCTCVTGGRRKRQAEVDTRFFFGGGNTDCNCPDTDSDAAPTKDCKERPEGDTFYGCGCSGGGGGGLFGFGRKRRQTSQEDVNTRFLDFRCIGATILGRKAT